MSTSSDNEMQVDDRMPLPTCLRPSATAKVDGSYVLHLDSSSSGTVAAGASSGQLKVFSTTSRFGEIATFKEEKISSLRFDAKDTNILMSTSETGVVRFWDIRARAAVQSMRAPQSGPLWTVDASDSWLAAGAEETIYIWDKRNSSTVAAGLEDTHGEAVTCCRFDPADPSLLLTCSVDGQIAVTDMRELHNEDESFKGCVNTYDSLACIGLWGDGASSVWSHSHTEALHFWDWRAALSEEDGGGAAAVSVQDPRSAMSEMASSRGASGIGEIEYLQGCLWDGAALRAFGGNSRGHHGLWVVDGAAGKISGLDALLLGGHAGSIMRSFAGMRGAGWACVTGAEDGTVSLWEERGPRAEGGPPVVGSSLAGKSEEEKRRKKKRKHRGAKGPKGGVQKKKG